MYTLAPHQVLPLCSPFRYRLQGSQEGHIHRVLNLPHKLGSRPRDTHCLRHLNHPRQLRGPSRRFCNGKRKHRQPLPNTSVTDSLLRSLGYFFLSHLPPTQLTYHVGICRGSCHPSKCHSWGCRPQGAVEYCPSILRGHICPYLRCDPT